MAAEEHLGGCFEHVEAVWNTGTHFTRPAAQMSPLVARGPPPSSLSLPRLHQRPPPRLTASSLLSSATAATPVPASAGWGLQARRFLAGLGEKKE